MKHVFFFFFFVVVVKHVSLLLSCMERHTLLPYNRKESNMHAENARGIPVKNVCTSVAILIRRKRLLHFHTCE